MRHGRISLAGVAKGPPTTCLPRSPTLTPSETRSSPIARACARISGCQRPVRPLAVLADVDDVIFGSLVEIAPRDG